jgi:uncharacterized LabA/DUF88 family protein
MRADTAELPSSCFRRSHALSAKRAGLCKSAVAGDAMELARHADQIVLFSGDGDFLSLVEALQRRGVRVTVVSAVTSQPPMIADELRRQADVFTDLAELQSRVTRTPPVR